MEMILLFDWLYAHANNELGHIISRADRSTQEPKASWNIQHLLNGKNYVNQISVNIFCIH